MQSFTEKIVNLMKSHSLFQSQGGPIILSQVVKLGPFCINFHQMYLADKFGTENMIMILIFFSQIENEYGKQRESIGEDGYNYMVWAANMAVSTQTGVPWIMCKDNEAPDPLVRHLCV